MKYGRAIGIVSAATVLWVPAWRAQSLPGASSFRDSAGITIIDNTRPQWSAAQMPRLTSAPTLVIGTQAGAPYELSRVAGAVRMDDGRIVIADGDSRQLRFFDATGDYIKTVGRRGDGPGEFQQLGRLTRLRGDTIVAFDERGLVSFFTGTGGFISSTNIRLLPRPEAGGMPRGIRQVLGAFAVDTVIVATLYNPNPRARGQRWIDSTPLTIVGKDNAVVGDLGRQPSMAVVMDDHPRPPWFGAALAFANNPTKLYLGLGTEYSIRAYSPDGNLRTIIRRSWSPTKVTTADIDRYVVEWGKRWIKSTGAAADAERRDLRDDPYAETIPAFSEFIVDRTGRLWVRSPNLADAPGAGQLNTLPLAPSSWSLFDSSGRWLAVVSMPARFHPKEIGLDYVLGVARDDDGVETVVMYRMRTGNSPR